MVLAMGSVSKPLISAFQQLKAPPFRAGEAYGNVLILWVIAASPYIHSPPPSLLLTILLGEPSTGVPYFWSRENLALASLRLSGCGAIMVIPPCHTPTLPLLGLGKPYCPPRPIGGAPGGTIGIPFTD